MLFQSIFQTFQVGRRNRLCQPDSIGGQIKEISVPVHLSDIHQIDHRFSVPAPNFLRCFLIW